MKQRGREEVLSKGKLDNDPAFYCSLVGGASRKDTERKAEIKAKKKKKNG